MLENPEEGFPEAVARTKPQVVAIYEDNFNFLSKMCLSRMRQIAFGMIDVGASLLERRLSSMDPMLRIIMPEYLDRGADYVLLGEAEWTLLELVEVARWPDPAETHVDIRRTGLRRSPD